MASPEYLICLNCETPCYVFEWSGDGAKEALCEACGNDEPENFATPDDYDAMAGA